MDLEQNTGTGIALNVTRTRVTVLVFNLTVISVMLSILVATRDAAGHHDIMAHLTSFAALFIGFCLTILGVFWLLHSQSWDAQGLSHPRPFTFGTITTYLALSQTITAFMHEYILSFESGIEANILSSVPPNALGDPAMLILICMGGAVWLLITYVAPLLAALKGSSLYGGRRWVIAGYYFALQIPTYWVYAEAWHLTNVSPEQQPVNMLGLFALQFIQPLLWFN